MEPIEIIVIVAAVAIVAGSIIAAIVRKKKGKCSCGCSDCPYSGKCNKDK